jgi:hypothetical protein
MSVSLSFPTDLHAKLLEHPKDGEAGDEGPPRTPCTGCGAKWEQQGDYRYAITKGAEPPLPPQTPLELDSQGGDLDLPVEGIGAQPAPIPGSFPNPVVSHEPDGSTVFVTRHERRDPPI